MGRLEAVVTRRVLGLDPGLGRLGFGLVRQEGSKLTAESYGLIETGPGPLPGRLFEIQGRLEALLAETRPDAVATERLLFAANKTTALDVAKALGVALALVGREGLPWLELSPPEVKLGVVGHGGADKNQVRFMVTRLLALAEPPRPDDVADALAIAIAALLKGELAWRT
jgi:crossover junction endodeoxyribonuclease RuvC